MTPPQEYLTVPLSGGAVALVDAEDYALVSQYRWFHRRTTARCHSEYAVAHDTGHGKSSIMLRMHRLILNAPPEMVVDHINGDGLDNRRSNLRLAVRAQNSWNQKKRKTPTTSKFKGVSLDRRRSLKSGKCWVAGIKVGYKRTHIGYFWSEEDAARAYDMAARERFGTFAKTNFAEAA